MVEYLRIVQALVSMFNVFIIEHIPKGIMTVLTNWPDLPQPSGMMRT